MLRRRWPFGTTQGYLTEPVSARNAKKKKKKSERTEEINFFHNLVAQLSQFQPANLTWTSTTACRKDSFTFRCWCKDLVGVVSHSSALLGWNCVPASFGNPLSSLEPRGLWSLCGFLPCSHSSLCGIFHNSGGARGCFPIFFKGTLTLDLSFDLCDSLLCVFVLGCGFKHPQQSCFWPPSSGTTDLHAYHVK